MNEQPSGLVLKLKHVVDSPRERIFNLLTEPAELAKRSRRPVAGRRR
jgi:uncharacterized protein YndB with AHSA1/START domain